MAIVLYEHFVHFTRIILHTNIPLKKKNIHMNMYNSHIRLQCMYIVEKYFFAILLKNHGKKQKM